MRIFTPEEAAQNGKAVEAFLLGKPIQWQPTGNGVWFKTNDLRCVGIARHRPAPEPEPSPFWSRMEDVPLNAWMRKKGDDTISAITKIMSSGPKTENTRLYWSELTEWEYTTGERDLNGALLFRECRVEAKP